MLTARRGHQVVVVIAATDARIIEVRPFRVQDELARGRFVVVAG